MIEFWWIISVILSLWGYPSYIKGILLKRIHPHTYTWLPWFILSTIGFILQIKNNAWLGAWALGIATVWCAVILLLSLRFWEKNITSTDTWSLIASLLIIPLWLTTKNDLLAVILVCIVDSISYYPTWRKSYQKPFEEDILIYALSSIKSLFSIFALQNIILINWLYPIVLFLLNGGFVIYLLVRRKVITRHKLWTG